MKVAIITLTASWYNDTMYLKELEKRLCTIGITAKVFLIEGTNALGFLNKIGITHFLKILKMLKKLREYNIIHIQFTTPLGFNFVLFSILSLLKKPMIIHTHGYDVFTVPNIQYGLRRNFFGKVLTKFTWNRVNKIIAVCNRAKKVIEESGIKNEKIKVLYNGVDENYFKKIQDTIPSDLSTIRENSDIIFLCVASFVPVKNHTRLIKAFESVLKKYEMRKKIKLVLVGPYNKNDVHESKNQNIHYFGKKSHYEIRKFYSNVDAFILPSLSEAHPWALLEAMSCELPVIASNVGGIPETLEDKNFLCNPFDQNDMQLKIEQIIIMTDAERRKIGIANRQRVLNHFTLDKHVTQLKRIYEGIL